MENNALSKRLKNTFTTLIETLEGLDQQQLNKMPFEGSWTAAQLGDHLFQSYDVLGTLNGNVVVPQRPADEKVKEIEALFLNFEIKMQSPKEILPFDGEELKDELLHPLRSRTTKLTDFAESVALSPLCLDDEFPGFGPLTRYEWLVFCDVHTQRHLHQLSGIIASL